MYTLIFLICSVDGQCIQKGHERPFRDVEQCEALAGLVMDNVDQQVQQGAIAPHLSMYKCVSWGASS